MVVTGAASAQEKWNGGYIGLNAGAGFGNVSVTDSGSGVPPGPFKYTVSGGLAGLTAGYNWQAGVFVLGAEGDVDYFAPAGKGYIASSNPAYHQDLTLSSGLLADLTARIGLGLGDTLFYAKGGIVYYGGQAKQQTTKPGYAATASGAFSGYTIGGGVEHYFTDQISIKAEYQHMGFGAVTGYQTATVDDLPTTAGTKFYNSTDLSLDSVKVGVNFHF